MSEKEENTTKIDTKVDIIDFIPLILFEKYIEITDNGIEFLKSFNNKVNINI